MILKLTLNTRMICMIFIKTLRNKIQIKNAKYLLFFNDMIADMLSEKKLSNSNWIIYQSYKTENFSCVYYTITFCCTKKQFDLKSSNKGELQQIPFNHSWDIDFKGFMSLYKICSCKIILFFNYQCNSWIK